MFVIFNYILVIVIIKKVDKLFLIFFDFGEVCVINCVVILKD